MIKERIISCCTCGRNLRFFQFLSYEVQKGKDNSIATLTGAVMIFNSCFIVCKKNLLIILRFKGVFALLNFLLVFLYGVGIFFPKSSKTILKLSFLIVFMRMTICFVGCCYCYPPRSRRRGINDLGKYYFKFIYFVERFISLFMLFGHVLVFSLKNFKTTQAFIALFVVEALSFFSNLVFISLPMIMIRGSDGMKFFRWIIGRKGVMCGKIFGTLCISFLFFIFMIRRFHGEF